MCVFPSPADENGLMQRLQNSPHLVLTGVGVAVGFTVGDTVIFMEGRRVSVTVLVCVGCLVIVCVFVRVGVRVNVIVGVREGIRVNVTVGDRVGMRVMVRVGVTGDTVGVDRISSRWLASCLHADGILDAGNASKAFQSRGSNCLHPVNPGRLAR